MIFKFSQIQSLLLPYEALEGCSRLFVYKCPELHHVASISLYHDIPNHTNCFVLLYQVWGGWPLCEERHLWLLYAMILKILG